jgi:type I restriction enzyme S subunit
MADRKDMPDGWKVERLGDFVIYQKGKKPKRIEKKRTQESPFAYVNIKAFEKNIIDDFTDGEGCVLCEDGDFLMVWDGARSGYIGKAIKGALGSTLVKINFPGIFLNYAYYFLQSKYLQINTKAKGTGIPHVDPDLLWNYYFPIPSIFEQQQIVSKIEEFFSELDNGIESLKKAREQLKTYRQAVLKYAFEGKLTEEWRNFSNVYDNNYLRKLKIKVDKFNNNKSGQDLPRSLPPIDLKKLRLLPFGWVWIEAHKICQSVRDGTHDTPKYVKTGIPLITSKNLKNGKIGFSNIQFISEKDHIEINKRSSVESEDILFGMIGTIGNAVIISSNNNFSIKNVGIFKKNLEFILSKYLKYWLDSSALLKILDDLQLIRGTTQKFIPLGSLRVLPIPYSSMEEQQAIVSEIESRLSVCDKLEQTIEDSLKKAEALRQSILKKAFNGELTRDWREKNPELISGENSAGKLLERIKAERNSPKSPLSKGRHKNIAIRQMGLPFEKSASPRIKKEISRKEQRDERSQDQETD